MQIEIKPPCRFQVSIKCFKYPEQYLAPSKLFTNVWSQPSTYHPYNLLLSYDLAAIFHFPNIFALLISLLLFLN